MEPESAQKRLTSKQAWARSTHESVISMKIELRRVGINSRSCFDLDHLGIFRSRTLRLILRAAEVHRGKSRTKEKSRISLFYSNPRLSSMNFFTAIGRRWVSRRSRLFRVSSILIKIEIGELLTYRSR